MLTAMPHLAAACVYALYLHDGIVPNGEMELVATVNQPVLDRVCHQMNASTHHKEYHQELLEQRQ